MPKLKISPIAKARIKARTIGSKCTWDAWQTDDAPGRQKDGNNKKKAKTQELAVVIHALTTTPLS